MLALAAIVALQAGGPPVPGPGGGFLQLVDTTERGTSPQVLGVESAPFASGSFDVHVFDMDAAGSLSISATIPLSEGVRRAHALGTDRLILEDSQRWPRVYERSGGTWVAGPSLLPSPLLGTNITYGANADIDGQLVAHSFPEALTEAVQIDDLSVAGAATTEAVFPLGASHRNIALSMEDGILVIASGVSPASGFEWFTDVEVRIFERSSVATWSEVLPAPSPPAGFTWEQGFRLSVATSAGRVAIAGPSCGEAWVYTRAPGAGFSLDATVSSSRLLEIAPGSCRSFDRVELDGDDLALTTGLDAAGERFRRNAAGVWNAQEVARSDRGSSGIYRFAGSFLVSQANSGGIQVHDSTSPSVGIEIVCSAPVSSEPFLLNVTSPSTQALLPVEVFLTPSDTASPMFLVVGSAPGFRPLTAESALCVGGALRISTAPLNTPFSYYEIFDAAGAGIAPGSTVYLQGFQSLASTVRWRSTGALAVTFAP